MTRESAAPTFAYKPEPPNSVLTADVCVYRCDPGIFSPPKGPFNSVPDVVGIVVSHTDLATATFSRIDTFLASGTKLIWVVHPSMKLVLVHRADGTVTKLRDPAELSGENVLPGFAVKLADFLPPVPAKG